MLCKGTGKEEDENIFSLSGTKHKLTNKKAARRDSLISIDSGDNVPNWTGMELQILKYAL